MRITIIGALALLAAPTVQKDRWQLDVSATVGMSAIENNGGV
jgi:hypothetical protein